jgi:hypothetical protein
MRLIPPPGNRARRSGWLRREPPLVGLGPGQVPFGVHAHRDGRRAFRDRGPEAIDVADVLDDRGGPHILEGGAELRCPSPGVEGAGRASDLLHA